MRKTLALAILSLLCACQRQVVPPTAQELVNDPQLLAEWQGKCDTGDYSRLAPAQKADVCSTTQQAMVSVAMKKSSSSDSDFFRSNSKHK